MAVVETHQSPDLSDVRSTLAGRSVLVTGGLGFLGKAFVEKLLRSVPDCGKVFLLVRSKRQHSAQDRLKKMLQDPLFERIRQEAPDALSKVVGVEGDITEENLGLSESDLEQIVSMVTVVVHSAATIRFDEHIKIALNINLKGTMNVVALCRKLRKIEAFLHVSTAYSQCTRNEIDEIFYATDYSPRRLLEMSEWLDEEIQSDMSAKILKGVPNTYVLTKALSEYWLSQEASDLPLVVFRPSIITASCDEPEPGWCDNLNGAHGLVLGIGKGIIRAIQMHMEKVTDCVPVDYCARLMVCSIWNMIADRPRHPAIYNCCTSPQNPVTYTTIFPVCLKALKENPYDEIYARPRIRVSRSGLSLSVHRMLKHTIPAYLMDIASLVMGKRPRMVRLYGNIHSANNIYAYFWTHQWIWHDGNCQALLRKLRPGDHREFSFDMKQINWETYWTNLCLGTRKFIMKEDPADIPHARRQFTKFKAMRFTWNFCLVLVASRMMYLAGQRYQWMHGLWISFLSFIFKLLKATSLLSLAF